jgi:hypothetical protein
MTRNKPGRRARHKSLRGSAASAGAGALEYSAPALLEARVALTDGDTLLLLHNPRCSKSRAVRALLEERGVAFRERRYLEQPLNREELDELRRRLGRPARVQRPAL